MSRHLHRIVVAQCLAWILLVGLLPAHSATVADAGTEKNRIALSGRVQDADGQAMPNAKVEIAPMKTGFQDGAHVLGFSSAEPTTVATSGPDGLFHLPVAEPGVYRARVSAEGTVPMVYLPLVMSQSRALPPVHLQSAETHPVQVTDPRGRALSGAWVFVENARGSVWGSSMARGWMPDFRRQKTDERGITQIIQAQGEQLFLRAVHPELGFSEPSPPPSEHDDRPRRLTVRRQSAQPALIHRLSGAPEPSVLARIGKAAWPVAISDDRGQLSLPASDAEIDLWLMSPDGRRLKHTVTPSGSPESLSLVFPSVERIVGSVIDAETGSPIADAVVWSGTAPALGRVTDDLGRYETVAPSTGRFWLQAEAEGRRSQRQWVSRDNLSPTFALHRAVTIRGHVVDELDRPVRHALLEARPLEKESQGPYFPGRVEAAALAEADGTFTLTGLEPGAWYEVRVGRPGFHPLSVRMGAPGRPSATTSVEVMLTSSRRAFGVVVDLDERPIADAEVILTRADRGTLPKPSRRRSAAQGDEPPKPSGGEQRARTDERGRFQIEGVHGRAVDLTVYAPRHARTRVRDLLLEDRRATDLGTILMPEGTTIEGRVVAEDDRPVQRAAIYSGLEHLAAMDPRELVGWEPDAVTDADGRFTVSGFNAGDRVELLAFASGFAPGRRRGVVAPTDPRVVLRLEPAARIFGSVVDSEKRPVPGAEIEVVASRPLAGSEDRPELGQSSRHRGAADGSGRFELDVPPGLLQITAKAAAWISPEPVELDVRDGSPPAIELVLQRGQTLFGWVIDSRGRPIADAQVAADGLSAAMEASAYSDAEGYFELTGLLPGEVLLSASRRGFVEARRELDPERQTEGVELVLREGLEVSGRVADPQGSGVHGARVQLIGDGLETPRHYSTHSATDGELRIPAVEPGTYWLEVFHPDYGETQRSRRVDVSPALGRLQITLEPAATLSGRILGLDFDQLTTVEVAASSGERSPRTARIDYLGQFSIEGLGPGSWLLEASLPDGERKTQARVWVEAGSRDLHQDLEFRSALTLQGVVTADGQPLDDTRLSLSGLDLDVQRTVSTDHLGRYRFLDLEPGRYRLGAMHIRNMLVANRRLDLRSDQTLDLQLQASQVSGRLVDPSGEGVSDARLTLRRQRDAEHVQEFMITDSGDAEGHFRFPRVPAGLYRLEARRQGYLPEEQEIEVPAEADVTGLQLVLDPTTGIRVRVRLASGAIPPQIVVAGSGPDGLPLPPQSAHTDGEGRAHLSSISPDAGPVWIGAQGAVITSFDPQSQPPGSEPLITLSPGSRTTVRIPALATSDTWSVAELFDDSGRPMRSFQSAGGFQTAWSFAGGLVEIPDVPAGPWTLTVTTGEGRKMSRPIQISGPQTEIVLQ